MQLAAALNLIVLLTSALQGVFNMVGAAVPVSEIIAGHIKNGDNKWTPEERQKIVDALESARATADQQITDAGA